MLALAREAGCQFILAKVQVEGSKISQSWDRYLVEWIDYDAPSLIDKVYVAYATGDDEFTNFFNEHIEIPFSNNVSKSMDGTWLTRRLFTILVLGNLPSDFHTQKSRRIFIVI